MFYDLLSVLPISVTAPGAQASAIEGSGSANNLSSNDDFAELLDDFSAKSSTTTSASPHNTEESLQASEIQAPQQGATGLPASGKALPVAGNPLPLSQEVGLRDPLEQILPSIEDAPPLIAATDIQPQSGAENAGLEMKEQPSIGSTAQAVQSENNFAAVLPSQTMSVAGFDVVADTAVSPGTISPSVQSVNLSAPATLPQGPVEVPAIEPLMPEARKLTAPVSLNQSEALLRQVGATAGANPPPPSKAIDSAMPTSTLLSPPQQAAVVQALAEVNPRTIAPANAETVLASAPQPQGVKHDGQNSISLDEMSRSGAGLEGLRNSVAKVLPEPAAADRQAGIPTQSGIDPSPAKLASDAVLPRTLQAPVQNVDPRTSQFAVLPAGIGAVLEKADSTASVKAKVLENSYAKSNQAYNGEVKALQSSSPMKAARPRASANAAVQTTALENVAPVVHTRAESAELVGAAPMKQEVSPQLNLRAPSQSSAALPVPADLAGRDAAGMVNDQIMRAISRQALQQGRLTLQLTPHELGNIEIEFRHERGEVQVGIVAREQVTRELLDGSLQRLRQSLQDAGVNIANLDVKSEQQQHDRTSHHETSKHVGHAGDNAELTVEVGAQENHADGEFHAYV